MAVDNVACVHHVKCIAVIQVCVSLDKTGTQPYKMI